MEPTSSRSFVPAGELASGGDPRSGVRWATLAAVFFGCVAIYHSNGRPHAEVDCAFAPYTAWSLVRHGSFDVRPYSEMRPYFGVGLHLIELADGSWVSIRPPGSALVAVPFVAPLALFREQPLSPNAMMALGKLVAAFCTAGAVVFFYALCRRLAPAASVHATVLFALGTCMWSVASQALWMHGPACLWVCWGLYALLPASGAPDGKRAAWAGFCLGLAVLTRPTTALFGLAAGAALLSGRRWRAFFGLGLGAALPLAFLALLNHSHFGNATLGGYATDRWNEVPPLWLGLGGLLVAPSRGLLIYSPALLLAPLGIWLLGRRGGTVVSDQRRMLLCWTAAAVGTVLFYARWHDWRGGWCYGPRFLCETMPVFCLLFALGYAALGVAWRRAAGVLVAVSVLIQLAGVAGHSAHVAWHERHELPDEGRCLFSLRDTQIEAYSRAAVRKALGVGPEPR